MIEDSLAPVDLISLQCFFCVSIFGSYCKSDVGRVIGDEGSVIKGQLEFLMII